MAERTVSRRARRDDYEDEPSGSRPARDDDERRSVRRGRDEDERPSAREYRDEDRDEYRRSSRSETSRRSRDDSDRDDHDERSSRRGRDADDDRGAVSTTIGRGRDSLRKHRETHTAGGNFPTRFQVEADKKVIVKFLEDDFFITYYQHWIEEFRGQRRQQSFICLGDDCPLCQIGDKPSFQVLINVIDFTDKRDPQVRVWYASSDPGDRIEEKMSELEDADRKLNDPDQYFVVSKRKGKNGFFSYTVERVKARDLEEDYGIPPLDDDELEEFAGQAWNEDIVRITPRAELRRIADELDD